MHPLTRNLLLYSSRDNGIASKMSDTVQGRHPARDTAQSCNLGLLPPYSEEWSLHLARSMLSLDSPWRGECRVKLLEPPQHCNLDCCKDPMLPVVIEDCHFCTEWKGLLIACLPYVSIRIREKILGNIVSMPINTGVDNCSKRHFYYPCPPYCRCKVWLLLWINSSSYLHWNNLEIKDTT